MRILKFGRPNKEPRYELTAEPSERETELLEQLSTAKGKVIDLKLELTTRTGERDELRKQVALKQHLIGQLETSIRQFGKAVQDWQRELGLEQKLSAELVVQRDEARRELAEAAAENVELIDARRHQAVALSDAREQLRLAQREIARVCQEAAEMALTADGLGLAMAELERRERKEFLDEDHRHARLMDGAEDHL